jgi:hypothetical protein
MGRLPQVCNHTLSGALKAPPDGVASITNDFATQRRSAVYAVGVLSQIHIGLVFVHSFAFYRGVLRGIRRFVESRPQWLFASVSPTQQPLRTPDGSDSTVGLLR